MADTADVLLKFCEQQWIEAKQAEDQRATFTNIILLISSAVVGVIAQKGLIKSMIPLSILIIVLGIFGAIMSRKLYERHQFHMAQLLNWRGRIEELHPEARLGILQKEAEDEHKKLFPRTEKVPLNYLWVGLHILIALAGIILTAICVVRPNA